MTEAAEHTWDEIVAEARRVWGDQLEPVPPKLIHPGLPVRTREFLATVGLPTVEILDIVPVHDERLLDLVSRKDRRYVTVAGKENLDGYRYGVDVETGVVMYLDDNPRFDCLANSNLPAFVLMLGLYQRRYAGLTSFTRQAVEDAVDILFDHLGEWDPDALSDEDSRWNVLLDEHATQYDD